MSKRVLPLFLTVFLLSALLIGVAPHTAHASKPVIVVHLKGALEADVQLKAAMENMTDIKWVLVFGDLTPADLADAKMLIMVKADATLDYTDSELKAVKDWLNLGGKTLWVAGDSDYGDDRLRQPTANKVLEAVGSVLRIESCAAEDPISCAGKPYRVLGLSEKCDEEVKFLVGGVTRALFHGPAPIIAYVNGSYVKLEEERPENVFRIMWTNSSARIVNHNPPDPEIHAVGDEGSFVLMAMEVDFSKGNIIIATGDAPFDHYCAMYLPELRRYERYAVEYPQQGARLFQNIARWALYYAENTIRLWSERLTLQERVSTYESQVKDLQDELSRVKDELAGVRGAVGMWQGVAAATSVVGLIIGVGVSLLLRRR